MNAVTEKMMHLFLKNVLLVCLVVLSLYFLGTEALQSNDSAVEYLSSPWNYLDVLPPLLIFSTMILDTLMPDAQETDGFIVFKNVTHAIIALMLWIKMFYFLRIFRKTGYFVSMLVSVVSDARYFFYLYFLINMAFYSSLYILSGGEYTLFTVFLLGVGDWSTDGWSDYKSPFSMGIFFTLAIVVV